MDCVFLFFGPNCMRRFDDKAAETILFLGTLVLSSWLGHKWFFITRESCPLNISVSNVCRAYPDSVEMKLLVFCPGMGECFLGSCFLLNAPVQHQEGDAWVECFIGSCFLLNAPVQHQTGDACFISAHICWMLLFNMKAEMGQIEDFSLGMRNVH